MEGASPLTSVRQIIQGSRTLSQQLLQFFVPILSGVGFLPPEFLVFQPLLQHLEAFVSFGDKKDDRAKTVFGLYSQGVLTSRDKWCYNFSPNAVAENMGRMIEFYNEQVDRQISAVADTPLQGKGERILTEYFLYFYFVSILL